jgi:hypothetical protein
MSEATETIDWIVKRLKGLEAHNEWLKSVENKEQYVSELETLASRRTEDLNALNASIESVKGEIEVAKEQKLKIIDEANDFASETVAKAKKSAKEATEKANAKLAAIEARIAEKAAEEAEQAELYKKAIDNAQKQLDDLSVRKAEVVSFLSSIKI